MELLLMERRHPMFPNDFLEAFRTRDDFKMMDVDNAHQAVRYVFRKWRDEWKRTDKGWWLARLPLPPYGQVSFLDEEDDEEAKMEENVSGTENML